MSRPSLALLLALPLSFSVLATDGASGQFQIEGESRTVADAIAWLDEGDLKLVFSDYKFDRAAFAADGELDSFDFMSSEGATLTVQVDDDGSVSGITMYDSGMTHFLTGVGEKLELSHRDEQRVAGTFALGDAPGLRFDLAISDGTIERPGEKLPADGGEPGKILLARIAAIHDGDVEELIANTPPDQAEEMRAAVASGEAEQLLAMAKLFTPKDIRIHGGSQDGDTAWIDFTGEERGGAVKGVGTLKRQDGRWAVESINTSQSSN